MNEPELQKNIGIIAWSIIGIIGLAALLTGFFGLPLVVIVLILLFVR